MNLSFKNYYWRWIKNQLLLFILIAFLMSLARLGFTLYFGEMSQLKANLGALKSAFILGLRYDLMPLAYINVLPFLVMNFFYLFPGKSAIRISGWMVRSILFIGYAVLFWIFIADYGFYSYFQDHLNILFFGFFEDDTVALMVSIWKNYNVLMWLGLIFIAHFALFRTIKFLFSPFDFDLRAKRFSFWMPVTFLSGLTLIAFFGRGNFTRLPLSIEDSHLSKDEFINHVSQTGVLTFNRALKIRKTFGQKEVAYLKKYRFKSWQQAFQLIKGYGPKSESLTESLVARSPVNLEAERVQPHVVLVIMESFGSYWNEQDGPRFNLLGELKPHFKEGIYFKNFLPAENGTIGSVVSVATAQVIRPGARFLSESNFMKTPLSSAGQLAYKKAGYDTHFIYGGKLGWRDLGKYLTHQGYDHLWGADEIKESMPELINIEERDLGNEWGIFDEYLYSFIEEQLRYATKPQFFMVLTTSNHPPFEYPSSYNVLPLDLNKEIMQKLTVDEDLARKRFEGIQYANQKFGEFLTKIKLTALNDKTVVALTGDHSFWIAKGVGSDEEFQRYAVPFFLKVPERLRPKYDPDNFGSHEDIFPSLYHVSLSGQDYVKLGEDLFAEQGLAVNSSGLVADKNGAFHHGKSWDWTEDNKLKESDSPKKHIKLKRRTEAMIGIVDHYLKEEKKRTPTASNNDQLK